MATKNIVTTAKKNTSTNGAAKTLALTDPRRKLTRDEWKTLTKEQKAERKAARRAQRGPAKARYVKLVQRFAAKVEKLEKVFSNTAVDIHTAAVALHGVAEELDALPDTWQPAGRAPAFEKGQRVTLIDSKRSAYSLLGDDLDSLTVVATDGRKVAVVTPNKTRLVLDAKHIAVAS